MKQIKTVIRPLDQVRQFDKDVNTLLANGWTLKNRKVIGMEGEPNEVGSAPVIHALYAELERYNPPFPEEITL